MNARRLAPLLCLVLAACGGGGGGAPATLPQSNPSPPVSGPTSPGNGTQSVKILLLVPSTSGPTARSRAKFVSPSTSGAQIVVTQGSASITGVFDLSATSQACSTGSNGRTCTVNMTVPFGNDTFAITTYDQAPVGSSIPTSAHILGVGSVTQNVVAGSTPAIAVYLGGVIATLSAQPAFVTFPADGANHSLAFALDPQDYDNNPITAGTNDPYTNPITISIAETGGVGNSKLLLNGTPVGTTATLHQSTDAVSLQYNGAGAPGYGVSVTISASGVATQTLQISPLYVAQSSVATTTIPLNGTISNPTLAISELNAPGTQTYTLSNAGCTGIATPSTATGSGASATFTVAGGATPSASGCTITVTDGNGTALTLKVTNTPIAGSVTIGGVTITDHTIGGAPYGITSGPDGNMWVTQQSSGNVAAINAAGSMVQQISVTGATLYGITTGGDGSLWVADQHNGGVDRVDPSTQQVASYPFTGVPQGITTAPDGSMWIADNASGDIWHLSVGGGITAEPVSPSGDPSSIVVGPDGNIYVAEGTYLGQFNPTTTTLTEVAVPDGDTAFGITVGPDGNIWYTASGGSSPIIGKIVPASFPTLGPTITPAGALTPEGIVGGIDNAVWYVDPAANAVGRINTLNSAATSYQTVTTSEGPTNIALGPDGSLWFTETLSGNVGHIIP